MGSQWSPFHAGLVKVFGDSLANQFILRLDGLTRTAATVAGAVRNGTIPSPGGPSNPVVPGGTAFLDGEIEVQTSVALEINRLATYVGNTIGYADASTGAPLSSGAPGTTRMEATHIVSRTGPGVLYLLPLATTHLVAVSPTSTNDQSGWVWLHTQGRVTLNRADLVDISGTRRTGIQFVQRVGMVQGFTQGPTAPQTVRFQFSPQEALV